MDGRRKGRKEVGSSLLCLLCTGILCSLHIMVSICYVY